MNDLNQISMEKIKKWFEKINRGKPSYSKQGIRPAKDWNIIVVITAIVFCLEAVLSIFIYFQIESGAWFQESENTTLTKVSINQNLLGKISGQVDTKATTFSASVGSVIDPSL